MKEVVAILDHEEAYGQQLAKLLNRKCPEWHTIYFNEENALHRFEAEHEIFLLLCPEKENNAGGRTISAKHTMFLTEQNLKAEENPGRYVYRFRAADQIVNALRLAGKNDERTNETEEHFPAEAKTFVLGIFSPVSCCYKTSMSLVMAQYASKTKAVLYLNLEEISALDVYLGRKIERGSLSDACFYHSQGRLFPELEQLVENVNGFDLLNSVRLPEDLMEAGKDQIRGMICEIADSGRYEVIIIDFPSIIYFCEELITSCTRICMPLRNDPVSLAKSEIFLDGLKKQKQKVLLSRIQTVRFPDIPMPVRKETLYIEQIYWGAFGDFTRNLYDRLQKGGDEEGITENEGY